MSDPILTWNRARERTRNELSVVARGGPLTRSKRSSAFTLTEIIVVIAILIILAAIASPYMAKAKRSAQIQSSLSRLKQVYLAVKLYQMDSDGHVMYGRREEMGLPSRHDINHWMFARSTSKYPTSMFLSACGGHPSDTTIGFTYWFGGSDSANELWAKYVTLYQEGMILVSDLNCTDPDNDIYNPYDETRALGVLLSGQLINRVRTGDSKKVEFYVNP